MANSAQAKKRARQAEKHRQQQAGQRSMFRTCIKNVIKTIANNEKDKAQLAYDKAVPIIDKMVSKGIIHKNKAARHKSRLNAHIRAMQTA